MVRREECHDVWHLLSPVDGFPLFEHGPFFLGRVVISHTLSSLLKIERLFLKIYVFTTSFFFLFHMTVSVSLSITRSDQ